MADDDDFDPRRSPHRQGTSISIRPTPTQVTQRTAPFPLQLRQGSEGSLRPNPSPAQGLQRTSPAPSQSLQVTFFFIHPE